MKITKSLFATIAGIAAITSMGLATAPAAAQSAGAAINIAPIQPLPGFGTTSLYRVLVTVNGRPVRGARVEHWFSGKHSIESYHSVHYTDRSGFATFNDVIPRSWINLHTWVDFDVSCATVGVQQHWRVKG